MRKTLFLAVSLFMSLSMFAQQALWDRAPVVSPEIHADNTVTFRLKAPKAVSVQVVSDFGRAEMKETKDGVWEYTTPNPLPSELYSYAYIVDGLKMLDPANIQVNRDVATLSNIFFIGGGQGDLYKVNDVPHGTVSKIWYDSPTLGMKRRLTVYTPAGYETSGQRYPVFYLLHGAGGDEEAWMTLGRAAQIMDNLIAAGKANKEGNAQRMMQGVFEQSFPDVMKFIEKNYRTINKKSARAIAGLSMGGFHTLHISKYYPDSFDYVGLYSAAIFPRQDSDSPVYKDMEGKLKAQFAKKPALYYIAIGNQDFLYKANEEFRQLLDKNGLKYVYKETGEGHIWKNWRIYLSDFAPRLFK